MVDVDTRPVSTSSAPPIREEAERAEQLRVMKRRATGVLVGVTLLWIAVIAFAGDDGWVGYVRSMAEASMVGGLADWFAVTAIFRHPLGLPIPHTAVIPARKQQFGETLGAFVSQNFLTPDVVAERVRGNRVVARAGTWLSNRKNAETVARHAAELLVSMADIVNDEDVHGMVDAEIARAVENLPVTRIGARALRAMTADGRHNELFDSIIQGLDRFLAENQSTFRERFGRESPRWLPNAVEDRIFLRLYEGLQRLLRDASTDPDHEVRSQFNAYIASLIDRLENSSEFEARGNELKKELLEHPALRQWTSSLWTDLKQQLKTQAAEPDSELRRRAADAVLAAGKRLCEDPAVSGKAEELLETGARYVADHFSDEIAGLVSGTVARWDAEETSRKLELLLGRDLQFIRINGTVVGGLAGLAIHGASQLFG